MDQLLACIAMFVVGGHVDTLLSGRETMTEQAVIGVSLFGVYFAYFFLFEWLFAATPGKLLTGLKIVRLDGEPCGAKEALIRTLTRLIEFNPLLLGGLPAALLAMQSPKRQRWGDRLAGTIVVPSGW